MFSGPAWHILAACPQRWPALRARTDVGGAVAHLLLHNANPAALGEELLTACLPVLACPELAALPKPTRTQMERLAVLAHRVRRHPRLNEIASDQIHADAEDCVRGGRLLHANTLKGLSGWRIAGLARDLADTSGTHEHLAKMTTRVLTLPAPSPVSSPDTHLFGHDEPRTAAWLLGSEGAYRISALAALAESPHAPRGVIIDALPGLHPVEIRWLTENEETPCWLRDAAAGLAAPEPDAGVVRILSDEELDHVPDPAALMASWLERAGTHDADSSVERAVLSSRHLTGALLRQLPAASVINDRPASGFSSLIEACAHEPARWTALRAAMAQVDTSATFGEFLDSLAAGCDPVAYAAPA
jgi:hypothetical protein